MIPRYVSFKKKVRYNPIIQQELKHLKLRSTHFCVSCIFYLLGNIFLIFFCIYGIKNKKIFYQEYRYDDICNNSELCIINISIEKNILPPIGFYYKLINFNQMNRAISKSFSSMQLSGKVANDLEQCEPFLYSNFTQNLSNLYNPCGLLPFYSFNDTFIFLNNNIFNDNDIVLDIDKKLHYKESNSIYNNSINWISNSFLNGIIDQHFIVWMRHSAFNPFKKLYFNSINKTLFKGNYQILIKNIYPTKIFKGKKYFVLSQIKQYGSIPYGSFYVFLYMIIIYFLGAYILGIIGYLRQRKISVFAQIKNNIF